jgi:hypothetical protein
MISKSRPTKACGFGVGFASRPAGDYARGAAPRFGASGDQLPGTAAESVRRRAPCVSLETAQRLADWLFWLRRNESAERATGLALLFGLAPVCVTRLATSRSLRRVLWLVSLSRLNACSSVILRSAMSTPAAAPMWRLLIVAICKFEARSPSAASFRPASRAAAICSPMSSVNS